MAQDTRKAPTVIDLSDVVSDVDVDALATQFGGVDVVEDAGISETTPAAKPKSKPVDVDALAAEFGAYEPAPQKALDEQGRLREVDPFGNLVPRSFRSSAPQEAGQRTPGRRPLPPKPVPIAPPRTMAGLDPFQSHLDAATESDIPPAVAERAGHVGLSALKGAVSVPEAAVGLADIVTLGRAGKLAASAGFQPGEAKRIIDTWYSERYQKNAQDIADASGVLETAVKALSNPEQILNSIVESIPLWGVGAIGRGLGAAGIASAEVGGAVGEGVVSAGSQAEQTRQSSSDGNLTLGQAGLATATGAATTAISHFGGFLAEKLGIEDIDTLVAATAADPVARKNLVKAMVEGFAQEGFLEELPQSVVGQVLQNAAQGKALSDGVDQAAVLGAITGGVMGAGAQLMPRRPALAGARPHVQDEMPEPPAGPQEPPETPYSSAPSPDPSAPTVPSSPIEPPPAAPLEPPPVVPPPSGEVLGGTPTPDVPPGGAASAGEPPDVEALLAEADQLDAQADAARTSDETVNTPAEPSIEVLDPETSTTTENASGESAASSEAISRQEGMKARGERFVVYNKAGRMRPLLGPDAVDYQPKAGETYGVLGPDGFRTLTDNGGKVPEKKASKPSAPKTPARDWTEIGKNSIGQTVYEDQNGVRSYVENGVRVSEPVGIRPTDAGMELSTERDSDGVPKRTEYQLATVHPSVVDTRDDLAREVNKSRNAAKTMAEERQPAVDELPSKPVATEKPESEMTDEKLAAKMLAEFQAEDHSTTVEPPPTGRMLSAPAKDDIKSGAAVSDEDAPSSAKSKTSESKAPVITKNADKGSVEVKFPDKPAPEVLEKLKKAGFRWAKTTKTWYSKRPGAFDAAHLIAGAKVDKPAIKPSPLDAFEANGGEPWQVTTAEWVKLQRGHREALGQNQDDGTPYAPNANYEAYHRNAVRDALAAGKDVPQAVRDEYQGNLKTEGTPRRDRRYKVDDKVEYRGELHHVVSVSPHQPEDAGHQVAGGRAADESVKNTVAAMMRVGGTSAPSGDASVAPAGTLSATPGRPADIPAGGKLTTARPAFVPELVAFIDSIGGTTKVLKALRSLEARGLHRSGSIELVADLFKPDNKVELARVLAHEIGHLVDWLPQQDMRRGNVLGRLQSLLGFLKHRYTAADGSTIRLGPVKDELIALSKAWREWPADAGEKYNKYRMRSRELYADAISALLNDPAFVQETAPTFFGEFFSELDEKPEVKRAYAEMMDVLSGTPAELIERRRGRVREAYDYGNTKALDLATLKLLERDAQQYSVWQRLRIQHVDRNTALLDRIADYEKQHGPLAPSENPKYLLEEAAHISATAKAFADKFFEPVYVSLQQAGVDWNTFGELLFYDRILAGDRSETANPQGHSPETVADMRDALMQELSTAQRKAIETAADDFRSALREVAKRAYDAGLYTDEMYAQMQKNPAYVTFRVLEYLDQNVTSTVYRQVGTLKDIQHPAEASIMKSIVTLKAAEHNKVKRDTFGWFDQHMPGEFETAKQQWTGRGLAPVPSKDRKLTLVTYKVKGKTVGKYVDPWVGQAFARMGPAELNVALQGLNWLTSKWLRPVFTTMNPGFMTFNAMRDFLRFWKNTPKLSMRRALARYYEATPLALARAFPVKPGAKASQWRLDAQAALADAEEAKILDLTLADVFGRENVEDTNIDQIFADIGVSSYAAEKGRLKKITGWISAAGDFIETLPKAAALVESTGGDLSKINTLDPADRSRIRRKVGSPDFLQMGSQSRQLSNILFLFSNAIVQGTRADVEVATDPTTRAGWWFKTAAVNIGPKLLVAAVALAAAKAGGGGDDDKDDTALERVQRILAGVSEYDLTNYTIVPLGLTDDGESIYLRMPQDDTGRLVGALAWKAIGLASGDKDALNTILQAFDVTAGQAPGLNPALRLPADLAAYASGNNVYDPFRSRMLFTPDELKARDGHGLKKFVGYEFQQLGGGIVWRFVPGEERPTEKSGARTALELPIVSNIVGRWIRVGDRGRVEKLRDVTGAVSQQESRNRLDEKDGVNDAIRVLQKTPPPDRKRVTAEQASAIMKGVYGDLTGEAASRKRKAIEQKLRLGVVRGSADPYVEVLMSSTSNAQKVAAVKQARKDMPPPAFQSWLAKARAEGVVSDAVAKAAGKER